jgi:hypothetical protein
MGHSAPGDLLGLLVETESRAMAERWYSVKLQNEQEPETVLAASDEIVDDYLILLKEDGTMAALFSREVVERWCVLFRAELKEEPPQSAYRIFSS